MVKEKEFWYEKVKINENIKKLDFENGLFLYVISKNATGSYFIPLEFVLKTIETTRLQKES